jgi:preprotein translocase subunit SecE
MARLQRKKPVSVKKRKKGGDTPASDTATTPVSAEAAANKPALPAKKKKASMPTRRVSGTTKSEPTGKIRGIVDQSIQFLREVKVELKKVAWPSKKQTIGSTAVVLILVFIIAAFLGIVDMGLSRLVRLVLQ